MDDFQMFSIQQEQLDMAHSRRHNGPLNEHPKMCANYMAIDAPVNWMEIEILIKVNTKEIEDYAEEFHRKTEISKKRDLEIMQNQDTIVTLDAQCKQLKNGMDKVELHITFAEKALNELFAKVALLERCVNEEEQGYIFQKPWSREFLLKTLDVCAQQFEDIQNANNEMSDFVNEVKDEPRVGDTEMKLLEAHLNLAHTLSKQVNELAERSKLIDEKFHQIPTGQQ